MGLLEDLMFGFSGTPTEEATASGLGIIGFVFWVAVIIGATFGGIILIRMMWLKFAYEGEIEIAPYRFIWMGKYGEIEGNLSLNDSFDDEIMDGLEEHTELKFVKEMVKDQIKNKKLFVYNLKITDEGDILDDMAKKVRIISPADLTLSKYTYMDQKGKRNLGSIIRREKRRNVVIYHTSRRETVFDEDGQEVEFWIVSPVPMVDAKEAIGFDGKPISPVPTHYIDIQKLEGGKAIAQVSTLAPILAEALKKYLHVRSERDNYARLYDDEVEAHQNTNMEKEQLKHQLTQKMYVGEPQKPIIPINVMNAGWILATGIMVFFLVVILPEYMTSVELIMAQMIGMGVGTAIMVLLFSYVTNKNKERQEKQLEG